MHSILRVSIRCEVRPDLSWLVWYLFSTILVIALPSQVWLGVPVWSLPNAYGPQILGEACAFLGSALFTIIIASRYKSLNVPVYVAGIVAIFGVGYLLVSVIFNGISGTHFGLAVVSALVLTWVPLFAGNRTLWLSTLLAVFTSILLIVGLASTKEETDSDNIWNPKTAFGQVELVFYEGLVPESSSWGGGIANSVDGLLLVTGTGEFYSLDLEGGVLSSSKLKVKSPLNTSEYRAQQFGPDRLGRFSVTDILVKLDDGPKVLIAHQYWNTVDECLVMRISEMPLAALMSPEGDQEWETLATTVPCIDITPEFRDIETGGRLAPYAQGEVLLTVGDHGLIGDSQTPGIAQDKESHYGKVLRIGLDREIEIFTKGHRNPQGLFVDDGGLVWSSEHGPEGGDEINLLREGNNYGWPEVTYGNQYGHSYWRTDTPRNHGEYAAPVFTFVPSIGISNLVRIRSEGQLSSWSGDLIIASLRGQSLFRARLDGEKVMYVEPISVGRRIRDVEEAIDGPLVLWTDEGTLITLKIASTDPTGEGLYRRCRSCHDSPLTVNDFAPSLKGIYRRPVASQTDYDYSQSMRELGGIWTEDRLDEYIRDPNGFAPGTKMPAYYGVRNDMERQILLAYLKGL